MQKQSMMSSCFNNRCIKISCCKTNTFCGISSYYRPHPKDGEGNVFSLYTPGGGGGSGPGGGGSGPAGGGGDQVQAGGGGQSVGGGQHLAPSCGRYASCVHAGGLSCFSKCLAVN